MALIAQKQVLNSTLFLKITACIIGYMLWYVLSSTQNIHSTQEASLAFYNVPDTYRIEAPDTVRITLMGKRIHLHTVSPEKLTIHIDVATLKQGENRIGLNDSLLFLPNHVTVLDYTPCPLIIHVYS